MTTWSVSFCIYCVYNLIFLNKVLTLSFAFDVYNCEIDASTLPAELQRLLNTIRELDDRSQGICTIICVIILFCKKNKINDNNVSTCYKF